MNATETEVNATRSNGGRSAGKLAARLREEICDGRIPAGQFLRTERQLAVDHGIARMTVRRALKKLEAEGLVIAEPRHGYRVLAGATDPDRGFPVAYVLSTQAGQLKWDSFHQRLMNAFQKAASLKGWSLLGVNSGGRPQSEVMEQLRAARVCGVALDTVDREFLDMVAGAGLPGVMVDAMSEGAPLDCVLQDNYGGAFLAAKHLAERGHKKIAWLGPVGDTGHSRARFGGAVAALASAGVELPPERRINANDANAREKARELLSASERPTGILSLWRGESLMLAAEAAARGLVLGKDLDIVGWSTAEEYSDYSRSAARHGPVPAVVTWSVEHMARMAMSRLVERRKDPELPPVRISVSVELRKGT